MIDRAALRRAVFVDSSFWVALMRPRDQTNARARGRIEEIARAGRHPLTSNFVVVETYQVLLARENRRFALRFLDRIEASAIVEVAATPHDQSRAREMLRRYDDKDFSLTDAISFAMMERLGIREAIAFDVRFEQYGFALL
jgi:predicted nucleic acid-binding protein